MNWPLEAIHGDPFLAPSFVAMVAARGASAAGIRLALQLVGFSPCRLCDFVAQHCRCPEQLS